MSQLLPRFRQRELEAEARLAGLGPRTRCRSGKVRHASEADALEALRRVREDRLAAGDARIPENRIYPCDSCGGWHLSSRELHPFDLTPVAGRHEDEPLERYAARLEKRIAEQRAQLVSMLALGSGASNRETRKRMHALVSALGLMTERWERERRHRIALVRLLDERCSCWWCRLRRLLGTPRAETREAAQTTERAEASVG